MTRTAASRPAFPDLAHGINRATLALPAIGLSRISAIVAAVSFVAGGVALMVQSWLLFWISVGVVLVSIPAGRVIRIMDDTVTAEGLPDGRPVAADRGSAADPGVRLELPPNRDAA